MQAHAAAGSGAQGNELLQHYTIAMATYIDVSGGHTESSAPHQDSAGAGAETAASQVHLV
jgi:hypothetical protein